MMISIITPCFNAEKTIEKTILSVISSKTKDTEYIIIDGGSSDGTVDIIKKYEKHIDIFISEKDDGMYHAISKGIEKSSGDIIGWLNADDIYLPWTLSAVQEIFNNFNEVKWLTGLPGFCNENGQYTGIRSNASAYINSLMRKGWYQDGLLGHIQQESTFWRKELYYTSGGLDLSLKYAGDFKLWTSFAKEADLFHLHIPLAAFRKGRGSQISLKFSKEYNNEVYSVSRLNFLVRLFKKINENSLILNSIFKFFVFGKTKIIGFSQPQNKWKIVNMYLNCSKNSIKDLRLAFFLYRK